MSTDHLYVPVLLCHTLLQLVNILSWIFDGRPGVGTTAKILLPETEVMADENNGSGR